MTRETMLNTEASSEENDLRARSTKKVKRGAQPTGYQEVEMEEAELVQKMNPIRGTAPPVWNGMHLQT